jgi:hypothetical protein
MASSGRWKGIRDRMKADDSVTRMIGLDIILRFPDDPDKQIAEMLKHLRSVYKNTPKAACLRLAVVTLNEVKQDLKE